MGGTPESCLHVFPAPQTTTSPFIVSSFRKHDFIKPSTTRMDRAGVNGSRNGNQHAKLHNPTSPPSPKILESYSLTGRRAKSKGSRPKLFNRGISPAMRHHLHFCTTLSKTFHILKSRRRRRRRRRRTCPRIGNNNENRSATTLSSNR